MMQVRCPNVVISRSDIGQMHRTSDTGGIFVQHESGGLREEVEAAALAEAERIGPSKVNKATIVNRFTNKGTARSTLYRWLDSALNPGKASKWIADKGNAAVRRRSKSDPDPAASAACDSVAMIPAPISVVGAQHGWADFGQCRRGGSRSLGPSVALRLVFVWTALAVLKRCC